MAGNSKILRITYLPRSSMKVLTPIVTLVLLGILSSTIKPNSKADELPDANCSSKGQSVTCLATLKKLEQSSRGFIMYLEGAAPYSVSASRPPQYNEVGSTFQVTLKGSPIGWQVQSWTKKY